MGYTERLARGLAAAAGVDVRDLRPADPGRYRSIPQGALTNPTMWNISNSPLVSGMEAQRMLSGGYDLSGYVQRAIDVIAGDIAGLPFRAGPQSKLGTSGWDANSPLAKLLGPAPGSPNPLWSAAMLWRYSVAQYMVLGKCAWAYEFDEVNPKKVVGLWPLMAQYLYPVPGDTLNRTSPWALFEYGTRGNAGYREFRPDQVFYMWRPDTSDWLAPHSPLKGVLSDIQLGHLIDQYNAALLRNGNVPAHLVITPPFEDKDSRAAFRAQFNSKFSGPANAGKAAFAEAGIEGDEGPNPRLSVDVKTIGTTAKDSQLSELRTASKEDSVMALGVPLSKMGDASGRTFANAGEESKSYWRTTIKSLLQEFQDHVNLTVAPRIGNGRDVGWFDTSEVPELKPERRFASDSEAQAAVDKGYITLDEYRADRSLPPAAEVGLGTKPVVVEGTIVDDEPAALPEAEKPAALPRSARSAIAPSELAPAQPRALEVPGDGAVEEVLQRMVGARVHVLMTEQAESVRQRQTGRRARKVLADAGASARALYDTTYWGNRMVVDLAPALTELGFSESRTRRAVAEVTTELFGRLMGVSDLSDTEAVAEVFRSAPEWSTPLVLGNYVSIDAVENALAAIGSGELTADAIIKSWS